MWKLIYGMCGDLVKFVYQHVPGGEFCLCFLRILFVDIILTVTYKDQSQSTAGLLVMPLCNAIVMPDLLIASFLHWPEYLSPDMHSYFLMIQLRCKNSHRKYTVLQIFGTSERSTHPPKKYIYVLFILEST